MSSTASVRRSRLLWGMAAFYALVVLLCWWSIRSLEQPPHRNRLGTSAVHAVQYYDAQLQAAIDVLWKRIEAGFLKNGVSVDQLGSPITDAELSELEFQIGYRLPGDLRASLKVHNGSGGEFLSPNALHSAEWIARVGNEMVDIHAGFDPAPLDPDFVPSYLWHPGWIAVGGWDVYQILVHVETGCVYYFDEANAEWQAISWKHWLENVAQRLEARDFILDESGQWADRLPGKVPYMRKYYTPGSEYEAAWE